MLLLAICFTACQSTIPARPEYPDNDKSSPQITVSDITIVGETNDTIPDTAKLAFSEKNENAEHQLLLLLIPSQSDSLVASGSVPKLYHTPRPCDKLSAYITATAQNLITHRFY